MSVSRTTSSRPRKENADQEVVSSDGKLRFWLRRTAGGIHVERSHRVGACRVAHVVLFVGADEFDRFTGNDELRFDYPLVYLQVRRAFDELFDSQS